MLSLALRRVNSLVLICSFFSMGKQTHAVVIASVPWI